MAGKTSKKPKLTKKMLSHLDKAEVRTIIMFGMNVAPEDAYQADTKWCIDHIYDNQLEFSKSDLTGIPGKKFRHDGVYRYVLMLQEYLLGQSEAPKWPPEIINGGIEPAEADKPVMKSVKPALFVAAPVEEKTEEPVEETSEEAAEEEAKIETPPTTATIPKPDDKEPEGVISERGKAIQAPRNVGKSPRRMVAFNKISGFGAKSGGSSTEENKLEQTVVALTSVLTDSITANKNFSEQTVDDLSRIEGKVDDVTKAILFIINSAILPEGETVTSLEDLPWPSNY